MRVLLAVLLFVSMAFSEFLETDSILGNSNRLQINDTLVTQVKPTSSSPITIACFDSGSNIVRECSLSVVTTDSVRAAWKSDTAVKSRRADTATIAQGFINSVATNYYAFKKADGTFDDSLLHINGINDLYFGKASTTNPSFTLFNNSGSAGSLSQLRLSNLQTVFGWYTGYPALVSTKLSAGNYTGYNKISLRTVSDPSPYTYIDHWAVYEETGQLVLNDSLFIDIQSSPYRDTWYPVLIKHAATADSTGLKVNGKVKALCKTSSSDSVVVQNADSSLGYRSLNQFTHAAIHSHDDTITTAVDAGGTYVKLPIFPIYYSSVNLTSDTANDQIIIPAGYNGYYHVDAHATTYLGTANVVVKSAIFLNETEQDQTHDEDKYLTAGDKRPLTATGIIKVVDAPDTITFRVRHDNGGSVNVNTTYSHLTVEFRGID